MKKQILLTLVTVAMWTSAQAAYLAYDFSSGVLNTTIPDGNAVGISFTTDLSGDTAAITDVNLLLQISGGYNGDLYGYVVSPTGTRVELFNRPGPGVAGNSGSAFNVTLDDQSVNGSIESIAATGNISGDYTPTGSLLNFNDQNANGTWRLFLADLSGGNTSQLVSWGLQIEAVPEPTTWAVIIFGVLFGGGQVFRQVRNRKTA